MITGSTVMSCVRLGWIGVLIGSNVSAAIALHRAGETMRRQNETIAAQRAVIEKGLLPPCRDGMTLEPGQGCGVVLEMRPDGESL